MAVPSEKLAGEGMERYVCVHGHFYQPPRENPWLEYVELQDSAYPYHDWNTRVTAECYAANVASRILDEKDRIVQIVNNYARMSFDIGPTLLAWLEQNAPGVYQAILEADRESQNLYSGHGSALAQAYNHMIMPLANRADKYTQVLWGGRDFEHRFRRRPEGMWLPETAVDLETLEVLAEQGILFTVLAPRQARRVRRSGEQQWRDVSGGRVDPSVPYELRLPSGKRIVLFFYDGPVSRAVAFEGLLASGEAFANRLLNAFPAATPGPQLVHIATDGETYGHHHRHGDMALAYAIRRIESVQQARLTNYGEYLARHPPTHEVEIFENTSWSCPHGVERWRSDCGCNSGRHPVWSQSWRAPLRQALDWLRDLVAPLYEHNASRILRDPWAARNDYISVILDRSPDCLEEFFQRHAAPGISQEERVTALHLLEMQRHAMLMYTSCGWFFDDLSGIETVQVLQYAGRAVQLLEQACGSRMEGPFLGLLGECKSNLPEYGDGRRIYEKLVRPAKISLHQVAAHYAVSSLFEAYEESTKVFCYSVEREQYRTAEAGRARLAVGQVQVTCGITQESGRLVFGVLHFGDHNISGGVGEFTKPESFHTMAQEVGDAFSRADLPQVIQLLDRHFLELRYSLRSLFRDEQRKVLSMVLASTLAQADTTYREFYRQHSPLTRFLIDLGAPLPKAFRAAAEFVLDTDLRRALESEEPDLERIRGMLEQAQTWHIELDASGLALAVTQSTEWLAQRMSAQPEDLSAVQRLAALVELARSLPVEVDLWRAQNAYWELWQRAYPALAARSQAGDQGAEAWRRAFLGLGEQLRFQVE